MAWLLFLPPLLALIVHANFPWVGRRPLPAAVAEAEKPILVLSDLHLLPNEDVAKLLVVGKLVERYAPNTVVVCGDLFEFGDSPPKLSVEEVEELYAWVARGLGLKSQLFVHILSNFSHDPVLPKGVLKLRLGSAKLVALNGFLLCLRVSGRRFYFTHGDFGARHGIIAALIGAFGRLIGVEMLFEKLLKKILRIEERDWLICGHTHFCGLDEESRVGNPGGWGRHPARRPTYTAMLIDDEGVHMLRPAHGLNLEKE